jgi:hypothetical protein
MAVHRTTVNGESEQPLDWTVVSAALDEAVNRLPKVERQAIILRFFHGKTHAEVATDLGLSPEVAAKKTQRALVKLRDRLARNGNATTVASLSAALVSNAAEAAPARLATSIASSIASPAGVPLHLLAISKGAIRMMLWTQIKFFAAICASVVIIAAAVVATTRAAASPANAAAPASPQPAPDPPSADDGGPIKIGVLAIQFEPRQDKPQGVSRLDILKNFPREMFDIKLIVDSGQTPDDLTTRALQRFPQFQTIDGADPAALDSLDVIVSCREWTVRPAVLSNIHDAVSKGVGLLTQTPLALFAPGLGDPLVLDLHGMTVARYFYYATGRGWVKCDKVNDHPILADAKTDQMSFHGLNGVIGHFNGTDGTGLFAAPELENTYDPLPETADQAVHQPLVFYPLFTAQLGRGRIVACQWYTPTPPPNLANLPGDPFYIRCAKWLAEGRKLADRQQPITEPSTPPAGLP